MAKAVGGVAPANAAAEQAAAQGAAEGISRAEFNQLRDLTQSLADQLELTREENVKLRQRIGELDAEGASAPKSTLSTKHDLVPVGYVGPTWWVQIKHNPRILVGCPSEGDSILKYQRYLGINFSEHQPVTSKGPTLVVPKEAPPAPPAPPAGPVAANPAAPPAAPAAPAAPPVAATPAAPPAPPVEQPAGATA